MLSKSVAIVLHPAVLAVPYRAYSRTCPAPASAPQQPVNMYLCGTATISLILGYDSANNIRVAGTSTAYLIQYKGKVVVDQVVQNITDQSLTLGAGGQLAYTQPFCSNVKVYP